MAQSNEESLGNDQSLDSFGVESHSPGDVAVARSATICEPREDTDLGPWEAPDTEFGIKTRKLTGPQRTPSGPRAQPYHVRWVVGGDLAGYMDEHGEDDVFTIPQTYDGMDNDAMSPLIKKVDSLAPGEKYGWGINGQAIERAFRALSGGGRYTASHWRVLPCGEYPWVLTGPAGTALCGLVPVRRTGDAYATEPLDGPGPTPPVEEQNQTILSGMERFRSLLDTLDHTLVKHQCPAVSDALGHRHVFVTDDDEKIEVPPQTLATLAQLTTSSADINASKGSLRERPDGRKFELSEGWSGADHDVSSVVNDKILAGWRFEWDQPEGTPETVATVATYWLEDGYSHWRLERRVDRVSSAPT